MPITRLTSGGTFTFTATSGSTNSISFIGGTETPFNYVFRNGIVTGVTNINSASNGAYGINDLTSLNNQAELHNNGTYRYGLKSINTGSWDVSNNNIDKSKLIQNGSLFLISNTGNVGIILPHTAPDLNGTMVKIIKNNADTFNCLIGVNYNSPYQDYFLGRIGTAKTGGFYINTTERYASIELISSGSKWLVSSYTGNWQFL